VSTNNDLSPMQLTGAEKRAILFVGLLLVLAGAAQLRERPEVIAAEEPVVDLRVQLETVDSAIAETERRTRPLAPGETINPNTASEEDLDRLPGIGPALAARIIAERERGGPFRSLEDLERVPGIGPAKREKLKRYLRVE